MKQLKLAVAALVIAAGSLGAFAFTKAEKEVKKATQPFHYVGTTTNEGDFANINNWVEGPSEAPCDEADAKPCEHNAIDLSDLQSQLSGKNNAAVLGMVDHTRS